MKQHSYVTLPTQEDCGCQQLGKTLLCPPFSPSSRRPGSMPGQMTRLLWPPWLCTVQGFGHKHLEHNEMHIYSFSSGVLSARSIMWNLPSRNLAFGWRMALAQASFPNPSYDSGKQNYTLQLLSHATTRGEKLKGQFRIHVWQLKYDLSHWCITKPNIYFLGVMSTSHFL